MAKARSPISSKTIEEASQNIKHTGGANKFNYIRGNARWKFRNFKVCQKCGYDKHVKICHVKSISSFPMSTLVSTVNDRSNIMILCPNCHWEYDHSL